MKEEKAIVGSIEKSKTEYFGGMSGVLDSLETRSTRMHVTELDGKKCRISDSGVLDTEAGCFKFKEHGFNQMLRVLGIPNSYARRIPNDLLQHDINRLFLEKGIRIKMTRDEDRIRGFVPASKISVPNKRLVQHLGAAFSESELALSQAELSDSVLRIKAISPKLKLETPRVGDIYSVGVEICNSDVGAVSLSASAFTLCLKCTNGAVAPRDIWGISKNRFGKESDEQNMLASFMLDVNSIVAKLDKMQDCLKRAVDTAVSDKQLSVYSRVVDTVILDKEKAKIMKGQFSKQSTVYQVQYAMTELSQHVEDVLQRRRIEAYAGEMLFGSDMMLANLSLN